MVETITPAVSPALAHIIERPRLIARLDEGGGSRVSVFAAPAGYGKTTLARQWSERQTGQVAWYRTTRASGDVALLAVQFDQLLASLAPELPRDPGKVASIASVNPSPKPLGRALVRTFEPLTQDILVIVDEWEAAETPEAEELLSMLVDGLDIRWVITTRERPEWLAPRLQVYGEGLEIGVDELRMTDDEAAQVLAVAGATSGRARVMRTADGWPAVLGLAAMSGEVDFTSSDLISRKLYDFLAAELLAAAKPETQEALTLLAIASISQVEQARRFLGERGDPILSDATTRGLLAVDKRGSLGFHPLLKGLLRSQFGEWEPTKREASLSRCRTLLDDQLWDEALAVAESSRDPEFVADAFAAALPQLLAAGRTGSLQRWIDAAHGAKAEGALIDYAESVALLRRAEFDAALALASQASRHMAGDLAAQAHLVAARAAHLGDRASARDQHLRQALDHASELSTRIDLLWLSFAAGTAEERPDAEALLTQLEDLAPPTHDHALRLATGRIQLALVGGGLDESLQEADASFTLIKRSSDPYTKTAFLNQYSNALAVVGRYERASEAVDLELSLAAEYDLTFVRHYGLANKGRAMIGMRRFSEARQSLSDARRHLAEGPDPYLDCQLGTYSAALLLSEGDLERASDTLRRPIDRRAGHSIIAEQCAMHALVLSALGESDEADVCEAEARSLSTAVETKGLLAARRLIEAAHAEDEYAWEEALAVVTRDGTPDALVLAWRACVRIAELLLKDDRHRRMASSLLLAARDIDIAKRAGLNLPREARPRGLLSAREREVHELIAQGLTNEEIANLLFISLSTTKVHVKHIFEKLGVRSRIEAARAWEGAT